MKARTLVLLAFMVVGTALLVGCGNGASDAGQGDQGSGETPIGAILAGAGDQTTCPMMGTPIDKELYVDHDGKRIYVCCAKCLAPIEENPDKYVKELEAKGVTLATVAAEE